MLDFYLIKDDVMTPDYPEQKKLEFITKLNFESFENLKKLKIIEAHFSYFSDFRWEFSDVELIFLKVINYNEPNFHIKKLAEILQKAIESNNGIIAYCD